MNGESTLIDLRVAFQQSGGAAHLSLVEAEHQSEKGGVKIMGTGHLSVNGHLHQGGTVAESACRALDVYLKGGIDSLCNAISGEFALLVLDRGKIYLIADLGCMVPLYWGIAEDSKAGKHLIAGTSLAEVVETFHAIGLKRLQPNPTFFTAFIADTTHLLDLDYQVLSPLEGVQRVPGSYRVELDIVTWQQVTRCYWDANRIQTEKMDQSTAITTLSEALEASVHECFSRGRVAISLSGGIDSGSIAYYASEFDKSECFCLTAGFDQWPEIDETEHAHRTAKHLDLEFHVVDCNDALPICETDPGLVYNYGLPVNILHEHEVCEAEEAQRLGASAVIYGTGGDSLFGIGHTPGYIWDLMREAKFGDAFTHFVGWTRRLGVGPLGVISEAKRSAHWSPPMFPPFLMDTEKIAEHLTDTALDASNSMKERVRNLNLDLKLSETPWTLTGVYGPRNIKLFNPFLTRNVIEASLRIPQWFIQHPGDYKWLLRQLMRSKAPSMQFDPVGGHYSSLIQQGAIHAKDRLMSYFDDDCRLVAYDIVSPDVKDSMEVYWRDLDVLPWGPGGTGFWLWNTVSAEMWLRGFEDQTKGGV